MAIFYTTLKVLIWIGYIIYVGANALGADLKPFFVHYLYGSTGMLTLQILLFCIFKLIEKIIKGDHLHSMEDFWWPQMIAIITAPFFGVFLGRGY